MSADVINCVPNLASKSYLELGVFDKVTFNQINAKEKVSVDLHKPADYQMSTDYFFKQIGYREFDVIYIDACHEYHQVIKDFNNAVSHLAPNGYIFVHDLFPPDDKHTADYYCGDGFKILAYLTIHPNNLRYYPLAIEDGNYGLTVFIHPEEKLPELPYQIQKMCYNEFTLFNIKTYRLDELKKIVSES